MNWEPTRWTRQWGPYTMVVKHDPFRQIDPYDWSVTFTTGDLLSRLAEKPAGVQTLIASGQTSTIARAMNLANTTAQEDDRARQDAAKHPP